MAEYQFMKNKFVNPYNFVPLDVKNGCKRSAMPEEKLLYGKMSCRFVCRTPLAIPDTAAVPKEKEEHKTYPFFQVGGQKLVPASELRGVIRNVYETLTDSCMGSMQKNTQLSIRSAKAFKPGLLIKDANSGSWNLFNADRYLVIVENQRKFDGGASAVNALRDEEFDKKYKSGQKVRCEVSGSDNEGYTKVLKRTGKEHFIGRYVFAVGSGSKEGYVALGETAPRRHFQSIFLPNGKENISEEKVSEALETLEKIVKIYRSTSVNSKYDKENGPHFGYQWFESAKRLAERGEGAIPVYYDIKNNHLYLSPAALGRKIFQTTLNDKAGDFSHQKCSTRKNLCPACRLFGTMEGEGIGSRIRFTDAMLKETTVQEQTFPELGSPRSSYLPFYIKNADQLLDGYDGAAQIRGRKFYWHHAEQTTDTRTKRNATFEVLGKDTTGTFDVFFDGITQEQLAQLCTSIHLNENDANGKYCHKLGHGKPVGYGSVKMIVEKIELRKWNTEGGWQIETREVPAEEEAILCSEQIKKSFFKIVDFDVCKNLEVRYPYVELSSEEKCEASQLKENILASHVWFSYNYKLGNKEAKKTLPEILEKDISLEAVEALNIDENRDIDRKAAARRNASESGFQTENGAHICKHPGCRNEVKLNARTNRWYDFCFKHKDDKLV